MTSRHNTTPVTYSREPHAAHYGNEHPPKGHDLERWTYAQPSCAAIRAVRPHPLRWPQPLACVF